MKKLTVSIDPFDSVYNSFVPQFAAAAAGAGCEVRPLSFHLQPMMSSDVVIMHWPYLFMGDVPLTATAKGLLRIMGARRLGRTRFVWVAHNLAQHDGAARHQFIPRRFIRELDGIIYLSERSRELLHQLYRVAPHTRELVTVHPRYDSALPITPYYPPAVDEACRLMSFGMIRRYKGHGALIKAMRATQGMPVEMNLAGRRHDPVYSREVEEQAEDIANLRLSLSDERIDDEELERMIDGAHGVVLPYRAVLNSGSAIHALSRARPVLVPNLGSMPELQQSFGREWVHLYDGELSGEDIARFASAIRQIPAGARPDMSNHGWDRMSADLKGFFAEIV
ncbi:hypothetical protein FHS61_001643 [Altererythrobacter atlanticus]|uniref:GDP-mannose:glycolipid 4-beta-D-mannosyltransferase n=1 Tax=Croceibacterium atlanticum TaxID=1267766 RepID=A0A0F7KKK3_9SPHN|nr:hypothetical protein [Croceibacterium atlanticum]AKH41118.1 GDP-mannose:glycolipid 4-beta-D-mannosyltransferase precursor [Croceibacterium atlanticum]MBB5732634.1 hypothetical protein [Croceibacterium atlanticum]